MHKITHKSAYKLIRSPVNQLYTRMIRWIVKLSTSRDIQDQQPIYYEMELKVEF